jgi:predicted transcriptional regulator
MVVESEESSRIEYTVELVSAYVANNSVSPEELPELISQIYVALAGLGIVEPAKPETPKPVVPINKSITPDYIICLEDGKRLKMLKRHLKTAYNLTPEEYRARWGLPATYPMVAPNYAKQRSKLAKEIGLGNSGRRRRQ